MAPSRDAATQRDDFILLHTLEEKFLPGVIASYAAPNLPAVLSSVAETTHRVNEYWEKHREAPGRSNPLYFALEYVRLLSIVLRPLLPVAASRLHSYFPHSQQNFSFLKTGFLTNRHAYTAYTKAAKPFVLPPHLSGR